MGKALGVLMSGIFVGAVGMEIINRKYPKYKEKCCNGVKKAGRDIGTSFSEGYKSATKKAASVVT